jgi:hypothetical protein
MLKSVNVVYIDTVAITSVYVFVIRGRNRIIDCGNCKRRFISTITMNILLVWSRKADTGRSITHFTVVLNSSWTINWRFREYLRLLHVTKNYESMCLGFQRCIQQHIRMECVTTGVRMKGIQNKKFITRKLFVVHVSGLCDRKRKPWKLFSCLAYGHAPPHFCHHVRNHLGRQTTGRWIGRGGLIAWPPRSPDLIPLDFSCGVMWRHCLPG